MIEMNYLRACILFLISNLGFSLAKYCLSENSCKCVLPDKTVIDLSSVGLREHPRFYDVLLNPNCSELYSYNPCFAYDSPDEYTTTDKSHKRCAKASACVKILGGDEGGPLEEHAIGFQEDAVFGINETNKIVYINYTVPSSSSVLQVNLHCTNESGHKLSMDNATCSDSTKIVLTLSSKCACPDGCRAAPIPEKSSPGLSTGSKLLIAFFTILLAYLIIGVVWNYCNGSQGMELIPNIEFWNELPTLIMEGVVFTCSCCGRQTSYGEV